MTYKCKPMNASQMIGWFKDRGGIAVWESVDLSRPGDQVFTPATGLDGQPSQKPNWWVGNNPKCIVTNPSEFVVETGREVKRFHIALRVGQQGLKIKCTDGSSRRIRKAVERASQDGTIDAWYEFDYETQEACIYVPDVTVPLDEWEVRHDKQIA